MFMGPSEDFNISPTALIQLKFTQSLNFVCFLCHLSTINFSRCFKNHFLLWALFWFDAFAAFDSVVHFNNFLIRILSGRFFSLLHLFSFYLFIHLLLLFIIFYYSYIIIYLFIYLYDQEPAKTDQILTELKN